MLNIPRTIMSDAHAKVLTPCSALSDPVHVAISILRSKTPSTRLLGLSPPEKNQRVSSVPPECLVPRSRHTTCGSKWWKLAPREFKFKIQHYREFEARSYLYRDFGTLPLSFLRHSKNLSDPTSHTFWPFWVSSSWVTFTR